jgi:hypothetical protein
MDAIKASYGMVALALVACAARARRLIVITPPTAPIPAALLAQQQRRTAVYTARQCRRWTGVARAGNGHSPQWRGVRGSPPRRYRRIDGRFVPC